MSGASMTNSILEKVNTEYLTHENIKKFMKKEITIEEIRVIARLNYIDSFNKPIPSTCPECGQPLTTTIDEDETICIGCGLITSMSIEYVGLEKIVLPYGRH